MRMPLNAECLFLVTLLCGLRCEHAACKAVALLCSALHVALCCYVLSATKCSALSRQYLRAIAEALRPRGRDAAFYLAAAVSDFFIPWRDMVRCQSKHWQTLCCPRMQPRACPGPQALLCGPQHGRPDFPGACACCCQRCLSGLSGWAMASAMIYGGPLVGPAAECTLRYFASAYAGVRKPDETRFILRRQSTRYSRRALMTSCT